MSKAFDFLPRALRSERFETRPKVVRPVPTFRDYTNRLKDPVHLADFVDFTFCIRIGNPVPRRYYRAGLETNPDYMLERVGVKHIHLGGQNSDVLLFAVEFPDEVAVLEINGHQRFDRNRVGELLIANHAVVLSKLDAAA